MSTDLNMEYQEVKFGDICREVKLTTKDPIADGYDKYIGLEHLDSGSLKIKRWGLIAEDNPTFTRVFKKGHILIGKRRPYLKKAAIAEFDGICSGDIIVVEPSQNNEFLGKLLPFIIQSEKFWDYAIQTSSGSLSPRTKFKELEKLSFNLTTFDSNSIECLSRINLMFGLINNLNDQIDNLIKTIRNKFFTESRETSHLGAIAEIIMGQSPKGENVTEFEDASTMPLLNGPTEFTKTSPIPVQFTSQITKIAEKGSILFCVRGSTTGRMNIADQEYCIGRGLAAIKAREGISNRYVYHILCHLRELIYQQAKGAGSTFPNISSAELNAWSVPDISESEANKITNTLDKFITLQDLLSQKQNNLLNIQKMLVATI